MPQFILLFSIQRCTYQHVIVLHSMTKKLHVLLFFLLFRRFNCKQSDGRHGVAKQKSNGLEWFDVIADYLDNGYQRNGKKHS